MSGVGRETPGTSFFGLASTHIKWSGLTSNPNDWQILVAFTHSPAPFTAMLPACLLRMRHLISSMNPLCSLVCPTRACVQALQPRCSACVSQAATYCLLTGGRRSSGTPVTERSLDPTCDGYLAWVTKP